MTSNTLRAVEPEAAPLTTEDILARIQRYVEAGEYPLIAAEKVTRELCAEGRQDELLVLFWPPPLLELWQGSRSPERTPRMATTARAPQRRIACEALQRASALMESLVQIDGAWVRLGDLNRDLCRRGAAEQKRAAYRHARYARVLHALAERLPDGEARVRGVVSEADLAALFAESDR